MFCGASGPGGGFALAIFASSQLLGLSGRSGLGAASPHLDVHQGSSGYFLAPTIALDWGFLATRSCQARLHLQPALSG